MQTSAIILRKICGEVVQDCRMCNNCQPKRSVIKNKWCGRCTPKFKGILASIFCIDINTHSDRKWKIMWNLFQKIIFSKCFSFFDLFIVTIISVISSTQIACDVMCVQYVQKQPPEVFFKKGVVKHFANLTGKTQHIFLLVKWYVINY